MARYLIQAAYTAEATAALASKPQDRAEAIRGLATKLGAELESVDFCLGEYDVMAVYSAPDDVTATAIALAAQAPGHLKAFKTTKLLSPQEFLAAQRKASGADYQGPSRR